MQGAGYEVGAPLKSFDLFEVQWKDIDRFFVGSDTI